MKYSPSKSGSGQRKSRFAWSQGGVTLIEVMIAVGVAGIAIYALVTTMVNSGKQAASVASKSDFNSFVNQLQGIFNNTQTCMAAFSGVSVATTPGTATTPAVLATPALPAPASFVYGGVTYKAGYQTNLNSQGVKITNKALTIKSLNFTGANQTSATAANGQAQFIVPLTLNVSRDQGAGGAGQVAVGGDMLSHTFNLIVTLNTTSGVILNCAGQYTDYWAATNNGADIIYTGGNVGIGGPLVDPPQTQLDVQGSIQANAFFYRSDARLKENVREIPSSLDRVLRLHGVLYDWKKVDGSSPGVNRLGLLAQEVEQVFPEAVFTNPGTGLKSVEYGNLIAPVIEAFKEQGQLLQQQSQELAELKKAVAERK